MYTVCVLLGGLDVMEERKEETKKQRKKENAVPWLICLSSRYLPEVQISGWTVW